VDYKHCRIKQYHKEGKALRTETTINDTDHRRRVGDARRRSASGTVTTDGGTCEDRSPTRPSACQPSCGDQVLAAAAVRSLAGGTSCRSRREVSGATRTHSAVTARTTTTYADTTTEVS
jgi:hypothetical protein